MMLERAGLKHVVGLTYDRSLGLKLAFLFHHDGKHVVGNNADASAESNPGDYNGGAGPEG